jgi:signal transduction histidine kinase
LLLDLSIIASVALGFYLLSVHLELSEIIGHWAHGYEYLQVDELPLTLLLLAAGFAWFGWRRWRELALEMQVRSVVEEKNLQILGQNRQLARQLILLQEQERRHLARELHDELGQCCVAIKVDAASIAQDTCERLPAAHASARAISETANHLQNVVRGMLNRLRPTGLDELGLETCMGLLVEAWSKLHGITCTFTVEALLDGLDEATNITIYRTVQESLTNIARHARATQAVVTIRRPVGDTSSETDCITLTIDDNGTGFPTDGIRNGFGVLGMSERVNALGGSVAFSVAPSGGARIEAVLPVSSGVRSAA